MLEIAGAVALSHAPMWDRGIPPPGPGHGFASAVTALKARVAELAPDAVVIFGPDHFRNFFYDVMPPFCIGIERLRGFGDFGHLEGDIPAASELGRALHREVSRLGFDPAISYQMGMDHGIVQPYEFFFPAAATPIVPIMINANGAPRPSCARCYQFGQAVGAALRAMSRQGRVLLLASGGMSHWVTQMSADHPATPAALREYVIGGRARARENSAARDAGLIERAKAGIRGRVNESWDRAALAAFAAGDPAFLCDLSDDELEAAAGNGAHELRTWLALLGAWNGPLSIVTYEPVPGWMTGMGCIAGFAA